VRSAETLDLLRQCGGRFKKGTEMRLHGTIIAGLLLSIWVFVCPWFIAVKDDGTYVVEFRTAEGEALAISVPRSETAVIRHFQERMRYGLFVPEVTGE
jgi:hypothetical protein